MQTNVNFDFNAYPNMKSEHWREREIFNGKFNFITDLTEFRMSLWIVSFGIIDNSNGEIILKPVGRFNLDKCEEKNNELIIKFRIYPNGSQDYEVKINPFKRSFQYNSNVIDLIDFYKTFDGENH